MGKLIRVVKITFLLTTLSALVEADQNSINSGPKPDLEIKCGNCPCDNPCNPPALMSTPPPPPVKKQPPPSDDCPPPPPSDTGHQNPPYVYVNGGPPDNVYKVYPYYSGSGQSSSIGIFPFLICIMFGLLAF